MAEKKLFRLDWDKELPKSETPTYDPEKQVAGLQKRIAGAGLDPEKAADTRNPVERALNLKPDQNLLFDVFEIINRPQQAIFGGIEAAQKGTDVGEGIVKGLTGQKEVRGTELLQNAGMEKNLGTDALGFILDVFADPIDLALIPVSGGLSLATNLLDGAADVGKIVKLSDTAIDVASKARYLDEATESAYNIMKANSKGLKVKFSSLDEFKTVVNKYKIKPDQYLRNVSGSIRQFISPIEAGFGLAGKGVKGVLRGSDKLLTVALRGVDDALGLTPEVVKAAKGLQELAIPGMKLSDDVMSIANDFSKVTKDVVDNMGYLNKYTNFKDSISKLTNYVAGLPKKLAFKAKLAQGGSELSSNKLIYLNKEIAKDFDDYVTAQIKVNPEYMNLSFEDAKVLAGKKMQLRQEITGAYNPKYTFKSYLEKGNNLVPRDVDAGVKEDLINFLEDTIGNTYERKALENLFEEAPSNPGMWFIKESQWDDVIDVYKDKYRRLPAGKDVMTLAREKAALAQEAKITQKFDGFNPRVASAQTSFKPGDVITHQGKTHKLPNDFKIGNKYDSVEEALLNVKTDKIVYHKITRPKTFPKITSVGDMSAVPAKVKVTTKDYEALFNAKIKEVIQDTGGISVHKGRIIDAKKTPVGSNVAIDKNTEKIVETVDQAMELIKAANAKSYGVWTDNGQIYFDISSRYFDDVETARHIGLLADQNSISLYTPSGLDFEKLEFEKIMKPKALTKADDELREVVKNITDKAKQFKDMPREGTKAAQRLDDVTSKIVTVIPESDPLYEALLRSNLTDAQYNKILDKFDEYNKVLETTSLKTVDDVIPSAAPKTADVELPKAVEPDVSPTYERARPPMAGEASGPGIRPLETRYKGGRKYANKEELDAILEQPLTGARYFSQADYEASIKLGNDPDFKMLEDKVNGLYEDSADLLDEHGLKFRSEMYDRGIIPHARTPEFAELGDLPSRYANDFTKLKGNTRAFTYREYAMSAKEANMVSAQRIEQLMQRNLISEADMQKLTEKGIPKMFAEDMQTSLSELIVKGPALQKNTEMLSELVMKDVLTDNNFIRAATLDPRGRFVEQAGFQLINKTQLEKQIKGLGKYMSNADPMNNAVKVLENLPDNLLIDNRIFQQIGILSNPKAANEFLNAVDSLNSVFKTATLMTPGLLFRNLIGNWFNVFISGVPVNQIIRERGYAQETLRRGQELLEVKTRGLRSLTNEEGIMLNYFEEFMENGFNKMSYDKLDMPDVLRKILDKPIEQKNNWEKAAGFFADMNVQDDLIHRMGAYIIAKKNPKYYLNLGLTNPADFVRQTLFDPNDLTKFEKDVLRRLIPFYTFTKKNLVYQMKNFSQRPQAYYRVGKLLDGAWRLEGINPNTDIEEYKRANFWLPLPMIGKDGKYYAVKTNLPISDLGEFISNPLMKTIASTGPLVRAPFELATNKQVLTGLPIQEFQGQKGYGIDILPRRAEYLLNQTGLGVPIGAAVRTAQAAGQIASGQADLGSIASRTIGRSLVSEGDVLRARRAQSYDRLEKIRASMQYYKQEGIDIPTVADIENKAKNDTYNRLKQTLAKYRR